MGKSVLKSILIATLPIFVYIIADVFLKNIVLSIAVAISISLIEFLVSFFIYRKPDFIIFIDLILIGGMGLISIGLKDPIFFKLKPAIIECVFVVFLCFMVFSQRFLQKIMSRYLKNFDFSIDKINQLQLSLAMIIPLTIVHIILIIFASFFLSNNMWAFISGVLFYIIIGVYFIVMIALKPLLSKIRFNKYKNCEWFNIVDEEGKIIGKAPREICHNGSMLLHPVIHVHIINSQSELLLQKRAVTKDIQPGKWDTSVGGHIQAGEKLLPAIKREVKEEVGIVILQEKLIPIDKYIFQSDIERELVFSFLYVTDEKITFQKEEIDEVKYFVMPEIKNLIENKKTTYNFIKEFEILISKGIMIKNHPEQK